MSKNVNMQIIFQDMSEAEDDSDDEDEDASSDEEDEATPQKVHLLDIVQFVYAGSSFVSLLYTVALPCMQGESGKKRPAGSASKTPAPEKKAKLVSPVGSQKTGGSIYLFKVQN